MKLTDRLAADPTLTVRISASGPSTLRRDGHHVDTLGASEVAGITEARGVALVGSSQDGFAWRDYAAAAASLSDAGDGQAGPAPTTPTVPALDETAHAPDPDVEPVTNVLARRAAEANQPPVAGEDYVEALTIKLFAALIDYSDKAVAGALSTGRIDAGPMLDPDETCRVARRTVALTARTMDYAARTWGYVATTDQATSSVSEQVEVMTETEETVPETAVVLHNGAEAGPDVPETAPSVDTSVQSVQTVHADDAPVADEPHNVPGPNAEPDEVPEQTPVEPAVEPTVESDLLGDELAETDETSLVSPTLADVYGALPEAGETARGTAVLAPGQIDMQLSPDPVADGWNYDLDGAGPDDVPDAEVERGTDGVGRVTSPLRIEELGRAVADLRAETLAAVERDLDGDPDAAQAHWANVATLVPRIDDALSHASTLVEMSRRYALA